MVTQRERGAPQSVNRNERGGLRPSLITALPRGQIDAAYSAEVGDYREDIIRIGMYNFRQLGLECEG